MMKNVLFCILMIYVVCGCRSQQPQEIVRLAVKSLDELQSVSAVLVSNAAFDGAELSDELASRIPFLFKQVVRIRVLIFLPSNKSITGFSTGTISLIWLVYIWICYLVRVFLLNPVRKGMIILPGIQEELDLMQQILDGKNCVKLLPILPGSSMYGWSGRRIRF